MKQTDARRKASRKWRDEHLKNVTISFRKEFIEEIDLYLNTEAGQRFGSRNNMLKTLVLEQMKRDGFEPNSRP